jgi:deoxyribodipyrimidine photo-lyase
MNYLSSQTELKNWVPKSKDFYPLNRNYDVTGKQTTSKLSSAISSGIIKESDIIRSLHEHGVPTSNKFLEEVFWRIYFRGYFETHPSIWLSYKECLSNDKQFKGEDYQNAIDGNTGILCFDDWLNDLYNTGYLHNHTRMWFASIWMFTLKLPWTLGCDLFMRYLSDADEASNILSWRWVAGLHTSKKPYVARACNIKKYTDKYNPINELNESPKAIYEDKIHDYMPMIFNSKIPHKCNLLLIDNFFDVDVINLSDTKIDSFYVLDTSSFNDREIDRISIQSKIEITEYISKKINLEPIFVPMSDMSILFGKSLVTSMLRTGDFNDFLDKSMRALEQSSDLNILSRKIDELSWNHCKGGFFKLKSKITSIVDTLLQPTLFD